MTVALSIEDTVCSVLHEALNRGNYGVVDTPNGFGIFNELRHDFPQAKIVTISLPALLAAAQEALQSEDE